MYRHLSCSYLLLHVYVCDSISLSLSFSMWPTCICISSSTRMSHVKRQYQSAVPYLSSSLSCVLLFYALSTSCGACNHLVRYFVQRDCHFCLCSFCLAGTISVLLPRFLLIQSDDPRPKAWKKWLNESANIVKGLDSILPQWHGLNGTFDGHRRSPKRGIGGLILRIEVGLKMYVYKPWSNCTLLSMLYMMWPTCILDFLQLLVLSALTTNSARTELAGLMRIMPKVVAPWVPPSQALRKSNARWRAEFKYDGERLQVHVDKQKGKVKLFSRILVERSLTSCTVDLCWFSVPTLGASSSSTFGWVGIGVTPMRSNQDILRSLGIGTCWNLPENQWNQLDVTIIDFPILRGDHPKNSFTFSFVFPLLSGLDRIIKYPQNMLQLGNWLKPTTLPGKSARRKLEGCHWAVSADPRGTAGGGAYRALKAQALGPRFSMGICDWGRHFKGCSSG